MEWRKIFINIDNKKLNYLKLLDDITVISEIANEANDVVVISETADEAKDDVVVVLDTTGKSKSVVNWVVYRKLTGWT